jgi:hypothetical protein
MRDQVAKENELLRLALLWQDKTAQFEKELFQSIGLCWATWTTAQYVSSILTLPCGLQQPS